MYHNFKVVYSRKNIVYGSLELLVIEFVIILIVQLMDADGVHNLLNSAWGIEFLGFLPVIMLYFIVTRLLYYVQVDGTNVIFKTRYGRKYCFACSDIKKIECFTNRDKKYGFTYDISIKADINGREVAAYVYSEMIGFSSMAAYLLEMHELGEIKEEAITKTCKKTLTRYKKVNTDEIPYIRQQRKHLKKNS